MTKSKKSYDHADPQTEAEVRVLFLLAIAFGVASLVFAGWLLLR